MRTKLNLIAPVLGFTLVASCVALQIPARLVYSSTKAFSSDERRSFKVNRVTGQKAVGSYGDLPLSFEVNRGQTDSRVKFLSRAGGYSLYLTASEAVMGFRVPAAPTPKNEQGPRPASTRSSFINMKLVGANSKAPVVGLDELPGKSNYFIGSDPKKWRLNIPSYSRVKYQNAYPGVDVVFYGKGHQLEYDFIVAPGAGFKPMRIAFDGARRVRLDESGDLIIETTAGEIRQRKPAIYQQDGAKRLAVSGGYVIAGDREIAFEVGAYDRTLALVIDPVLVYSTLIGGTHNDTATAVAVDATGSAYIVGMTDSLDYPTVNPFQRNLGRRAADDFIQSDAFVTKLNASGTAIVYSTYLGGTDVDVANGIALDSANNAYIAGYTTSADFPTTPGAFQNQANIGGDAFITKLNPRGEALGYSTRLGGPIGGSSYNTAPNIGTGIAVGTEGSAYVTGYTFSPSFPLKKPVQDKLDRGSIRCCDPICLYGGLSGLIEDAFVTKLNPAGTGLVYSTYLGGTGQDEGFAIALDAAGSAYVTGRTCSHDFGSSGYGGGRSDAFLVKLSSNGKQFLWSRLLGGDGDDAGNAIAVGADGSVFIAGQTDSLNLPTSAAGLQVRLAGSAFYATADGGLVWSAGSGLPNSPVNAVAIDPTDVQTLYVGVGNCFKSNGVFKSTDGGSTWRFSGLNQQITGAIAVDPRQPSTIYAGISKSTDRGASWSTMAFPGPNAPFGAAKIAIDPTNTDTVFLLPDDFTCTDFGIPPVLLKSTDRGGSWRQVSNGANPLFATSLAIDPSNSSTLYATDSKLRKSTDGGNTWRVRWEQLPSPVLLAIDPSNPLTLYIRRLSTTLLKSTNGGSTFKELAPPGFEINALVVDPSNSSVLYAATGSTATGGGAFKSTDGGQSWKTTDLLGLTIKALAIDPSGSGRVYAGASFDTDGFIARMNSEGSALVYSTYLGTRCPDSIAAIAVDTPGSAYVAGKTFSDRFPKKDALATGGIAGFATVMFATKLDAAGSAIVYSTILDGTEASFASGIAVDAVGKAYVVGNIGSYSYPTPNSIESVHGGFDVFVAKLVSPPRITGASISGKNLIITGDGFDQGAVILLDGVEQRSKNDQSNAATTLIGKKTAKSIAPGQRVTIQVRNSDGLISEPFTFTR